MELDLVAVAPDATPPVCKFLDFSHYQYEKTKRDKQARKKSKNHITKELKFTPKICEHDYQVRYRAILKFVEKGYKVKILLMFRGRESSHPEVGLSILKRLTVELGNSVIVESAPSFVRNCANMVVAPAK